MARLLKTSAQAGSTTATIHRPYSPFAIRYSPIYFFLPAIDLAGPLRVRALVWVR